MGAPKKTGTAKAVNKTPAKSSSPSKDIKKDFSKMLKKTPVSPKKVAAVNSVIKFALLNGHLGCHIVNMKELGKSPYTEKVFNDFFNEAINGDENFLTEYNPVACDNASFFWHHLDVKQKHSQLLEWHVRYFLFQVAFLPEIPMEEKLQFIRMLATLIADAVNSKQRAGSPILTVPEKDEDLLYAPREDMVVSDVVGRDDAAKFIRDQLGSNYATPFEENKEYIYQIFRTGELPRSLRNFLSAPEEEIWSAY